MTIKLTTEQFIEKAREIHGDLYNYELVEYVGSHTKIKITCPIHGIFEQRANAHLSGTGCKVCAFEVISKERTTVAAAEFTTKANIVHNNKYDYSLVVYTGNKEKVKILCKSHGEFLQQPSSHLTGRGCPDCALEETGWSRTAFASKCEKNNNGLGILYIIECFNDNERFYKIGITSRSIKKRYSCNKDMPYAYRVIDEIIGDPTYIYDLETKLHQINKQHQYVPEIPFGGSVNECFKEYRVN